MNRYRTIIMDADNTLLDFNAAEQYALAKTFREAQLALTAAIRENYTEINCLLWQELERGEITQSQLKNERFYRLFRQMGIRRNATAFGERYAYWLSKGTFLMPDAGAVCRALIGKYQLAILTNGITDIQIPRIRNSRIGKYFDHIIISEEIGYSKPDPRSFEIAARRIGATQLESMLMVGDSLQADISGAQNFGIDTCWFNLRGSKNNTQISPLYEIGRLRELVGILK